MLKQIFLLLVGINLSFSSKAIETHKISVLFDTDKYQLTSEAQKQLRDFIINIEASSDFGIYLEGHTDNIGHLSYNDSLSYKRALSVKQYLLAQGIEKDFIESASYGERKPYRPNQDELGRELNRRVEVVLTIYTFESIEELEKVLGSESISKTLIDPADNNLIEGKNGVRLKIERGSFLDENGDPIKEDVVITLTEALNIDQFIGHSLVTKSGDRMLVSGGMFKVEAQTTDGKPLTLDACKPIITTVPSNKLENGMQQFTSQEGDDWNVNQRDVSTMFSIRMPKAPLFDYMKYELPVYKRNLSTKPEKPTKRTKPRPPKSPDPLAYKADIKWYQLPFKGMIERKAYDNYLKAVERYEDKFELYSRRYELYVEHNENFPRAMFEYKKNLKKWNEQCRQDSINLITGEEYTNLLNSNKLLYQKGVEAYEKKKEEWEALKIAKVDSLAQEMDEMGISNQAMVNTYLTTMSELSWINIDRFYKIAPQQQMTITVYDNDKELERVLLVFQDMKSMLPLYTSEIGKSYYMKVPKKEKAGVLAYKVVGGKTMVYYEKVNPKEADYKIEYKPYSFREFKELLSEIQT